MLKPLSLQSNTNTWNKSTVSRKLLKMGVLTFETCWAVNGEIIKRVTSSWSFFIQLFIFLFSHAVVICSGPAIWFSFFAFLQSERNFPLLSMKAVLWDSLEIFHTDTPFACASSMLVKPSDLRLCYWYDECISEHPNMCSKLHCLECFLIS